MKLNNSLSPNESKVGCRQSKQFLSNKPAAIDFINKFHIKKSQKRNK